MIIHHWWLENVGMAVILNNINVVPVLFFTILSIKIFPEYVITFIGMDSCVANAKMGLHHLCIPMTPAV